MEHTCESFNLFITTNSLDLILMVLFAIFSIDEFLSSLGWERTLDKSRDDYKLKWCEIKSHNNYYSFKEGMN